MPTITARTANVKPNPRPIKPVELVNFKLIERPIYHCDLLPEGLPGTVEFNGSTYTVLPLGSDSRDGYRLTNLDNGEVYDVDTSTGYAECSCPDFIFRRGRTGPSDLCKHGKFCVHMRRIGAM